MSGPKRPPSASKTVIFVVILCLVSALVLAVLATSLRAREERARELDRVKQILAAARIYNPKGYFEIKQDGEYVPAVYDAAQGNLVPGVGKATAEQIYAVSQARLVPKLTDAEGNITTFEEAGIDEADYMVENEKTGFAYLKEKLFYDILPNGAAADAKPVGYIIPVNGFGLWGPIYGYLALEPNADTVIGSTWEAPLETPGLGAIIQDPSWQAQFAGKEIFLPSATGQTNFETAALGIIVVKGKVQDVYGDTPRAETAVDGISGATLTGNGVTAAFADSLAPYRALLVKLNKESADGS